MKHADISRTTSLRNLPKGSRKFFAPTPVQVKSCAAIWLGRVWRVGVFKEFNFAKTAAARHGHSA